MSKEGDQQAADRNGRRTINTVIIEAADVNRKAQHVHGDPPVPQGDSMNNMAWVLIRKIKKNKERAIARRLVKPFLGLDLFC